MEIPGTLELCLENQNDLNIYSCLLIALNRPFRNGQWILSYLREPRKWMEWLPVKTSVIGGASSIFPFMMAGHR